MVIHVNYLNTMKDNLVVQLVGTTCAVVDCTIAGQEFTGQLSIERGHLMFSLNMWPALAQRVAKVLGWKYHTMIYN